MQLTCYLGKNTYNRHTIWAKIIQPVCRFFIYVFQLFSPIITYLVLPGGKTYIILLKKFKLRVGIYINTPAAAYRL